VLDLSYWGRTPALPENAFDVGQTVSPLPSQMQGESEGPGGDDPISKSQQGVRPLVDPLDGYRRESCLKCRRILLHGEVYADGYTDGPTLCHRCIAKRNHE